MSHLPTEIYSLIFRFATWVPEALDTSFETIDGENRDHVIQLINNSSSTKVAISVSSKAFHSIMEPFLYETVVIFRFQVVPKILKLLRAVPDGYSRPRGHMCRRLDLYLGVRENRTEYRDEAWYDGGHTFWGLIPACPHLEILLAQVMYSGSDCSKFHVPHLTHISLWKTISTYCASTLRRLELYGFSIRMNRVETMLRYMTKLEVCSITHCDNVDVVNTSRSLITGEWKTCIDDEEEPTSGIIKVSRGRKKTKSKKAKRWFNNDIQAEFLDAKNHASWPPFTGNPPYLLPKLHTLFLDMFNERFFEFQLPMLRSLSSSVSIAYHDILFNTNAVLKSSQHPDAPSKKYRGCFPAFERKNNFYYHNPVPHSTPFGVFPSTLTHLSIYYWFNLAKILYFFPHLTNLTWHVTLAPRDPSPFWKPHDVLRRIMLVVIFGPTPMTLGVLQQVLNAVRDGWLLRLSDIVIASRTQTSFSHDEPLPFEECEKLGIRLSLVKLTEATLTNVELVSIEYSI